MNVDLVVVLDAVVVAVVCLYVERVQAHDSVSDYVQDHVHVHVK